MRKLSETIDCNTEHVRFYLFFFFRIALIYKQFSRVFSGGVPCSFTATIEFPQTKSYNINNNNHNKREIFSIRQFNVLLDVNEKISFYIYFEPQYAGVVRADLLIHVSSMEQDYDIQLKGYGSQPLLYMSHQHLIFPNVLPYVADAEKYICIRNIGRIPFEFCFADHDKYLLFKLRHL